MRKQVLTVAALLLTACGGPASTTAPAPTNTPRADEFLKASTDIFNDALAVLRAQKGYEVKADAEDPNGSLTLDLFVDGTGNARGTIAQTHESSDIVVNKGNIYVSQYATAQTLVGYAIPPTPAGRWIRLPMSTLPILAALVTPANLAKCMSALGQNRIDANQTTKKVNGVTTIEFDAAADGNNLGTFNVDQDSLRLVSIYIANSDTPPPDCADGLKLTPDKLGDPAGTRGTFLFTRFGGSVAVTPPPGAVNIQTTG